MSKETELFEGRAPGDMPSPVEFHEAWDADRPAEKTIEHQQRSKTMFDKFKAWCAREWEAVKKSGTMLFAWVQAAIGALLVAAVDLYGDPAIDAAVRTVLQPKYIPYYVIVAGVLLRLVRKHNAPNL